MKNYKQITQNEREEIYLYLGQGKSYREIGRLVERHHTTIKREVIRNSYEEKTRKDVTTKYQPTKATKISDKRRTETRRSKLTDPSVQNYVIDKLSRHWSPEEIAGRLKLKAPESYVSMESIYKFIYEKENKGLRLWEFLRKSHKQRKNLFGRKQQRLKRLTIPNKINISERPEVANLRLEVGHMETDLMEGLRTSKDVVSATVDRKSRFLYLDKLESKESKKRIEILNQRLKKLPSILKQTMTFDNGTENYYHEELIKKHGIQTYFCNPYHSWEKGTVENTIGLVRQYIPKKVDLSNITQTDLNSIALELNTRPRKRLGYFTPQEILYKFTGVVHFA
jgi:IS30 family transposase